MNTIAIISVITGFMSAIIIALDIVRHPQSMKIMSWVWILTGLWAGVLALIAYFWFGRESTKMKMGAKMSMKMGDGATMEGMDMKKKRPYWQSITLSTLHCGAGCTLADIIGEWSICLFAVTISGSLILGSVIIDYLLALLIGVYFQYAAIRAMYVFPRGKTILKAFKADVLSLTAWQIGMYGFMAIAIFMIFRGESFVRCSWVFWFMMQIAMLVGFIAAFPVNIMLIEKGIKKAM